MSFAQYSIADPVAAGLDAARLADLDGRIQHAMDKGPLPSIQVALARHGRLVYCRTFGDADEHTRYNIYSCTKPLVASAIWLLMGRGAIDITLPVAHYLPAFAGGGKGEVTVEQLLCHTSGFPSAKLGDPDWRDSARRLAKMAQWTLEWEPGSQVVYHPLSGHWVLAEIISAVTATDFRAFIHDAIIAPLGLKDLRLGPLVDDQARIAPIDHVGEPPDPGEIEKLLGSAMAWPDMRDDSMLVFNDPAVRALGVPGGGAISTAADVALFYQALLENPAQLWDQQVLDDAVGNVRVDFPDPMTGCPAHRGLGVVIAGSGRFLPYRGMGDKVSARAFGHQGVGGQVAWGDPETGLSFCMLTNGLDVNMLRSARLCSAVNNRAGACVAR